VTLPQLQEHARDLLVNSIVRGTSESSDYKRHLIDDAVANADVATLREFLSLHEQFSSIVQPHAFRTRHAGRTSSEGIGISYFSQPIADNRKVEVCAMLLPTKHRWSGYLEFYLSGQSDAPEADEVTIDSKPRRGRLVYRLFNRPNPRFSNRIVILFRDSANWMR
jgi:hypothetical protein